MFRDRTNLYISYRRTFPHHERQERDPFSSLPEEERGLAVDVDSDGENIEMSSLPPPFMDVSDQIDTTLQEIADKTEVLNKLYKKNLLPGFNDRTSDEEEIENLNYVITTKFQTSFSMIKRLESFAARTTNKSELVMLDNVKKNCALKIQQASSNFRKLQNNYIKFLKEEDFEPIGNKEYDPVAEELESVAVEQYSRDALHQTQTRLGTQLDAIVRQREVEINKLAKGVLEVSAIFREMQNLIIEQGTVLDRIDYNLEQSKANLRGANKELKRATDYQKSNNKCKIILLLLLVVVALFFVLLNKKSGGGSSSPAKPDPKPDSGSNQEDSNQGDSNLKNSNSGSLDERFARIRIV